jgi:hypothetical protein
MWQHRVIRRFLVGLLATTVATCGLAESAPSVRAGTLVLKGCSAYGDPGGAFVGTSTGNITYTNACAQGRSFQINPLGSNSPGFAAAGTWETTSPPAVTITYAITPVNDVLVDPNNDGYVFGFFWDGGAQTITPAGNCCGGMDYGTGINTPLPPGHHFGWQATCIQATCATHQLLDVKGIYLDGQDTTPPSVVADGAGNVFYTSGEWIRGSGWPASFTASADDGICGMRVLVGGISIQGPAFARNQGSWTQCPTPLTDSYTLDTTQYPDGPLSLVLSAGDAASPVNVSSPSTTLHLDNAPVGVSLSGPPDVAASAANASASITATAAAGPSGVNIFCSIDGGPEIEYSGASAQVPVSGIGPHSASCFAQNNAVNASGAPARSATETYRLTIRQPTAEAITFAHIADALRCRRVVETVKVRGRTRVVKRHGKKILIRGRRRTVKRHVRRCHARTVKRTVWVTLKRHGKVLRRHGKPVRVRRVRRVVVLPHTILKPTRRIGHGKTTTVSGYLGLANGTPLANRPVSVVAAANNGLGQFTLPIATVTTDPAGTWTATVPAGPSRLIEAIYAGSATDESATSAPVTLSVPALIKLAITPRIIPWKAAVHISGRLVGGYVPPDGVALRLLVRYPHLKRETPLQALRTDGRGRFAFTWSYHAGRGVVTYPFSVATTASESDYPYAGSANRAIRVTFGRATPATRHPKHRRKTKRRH